MASSTATVLHGFWASSCSWRVRAALQYKNIPFVEKSIDIVQDKTHLTSQYQGINPAQKVPALEIDGEVIVESMAILQYLEETRTKPKLVPSSALQHARMREIVETIVSGIQPLQNVGLRSMFENDDQYLKFGQHWTRRGMATLEALLKKTSGKYCVADQLTMADLCFVPQIFNATGRLKLSTEDFPTVAHLYSTLLTEKLFIETHPNNLKPNKRRLSL